MRCECRGHQKHDPNPDCPQHGLDASPPKPPAPKPDYIGLDDLVVGTVYKIRSRNLLVGVWTGRGFIGIREKFGEEYLFTEYHYDTGAPYGTVRPTEALNITLTGMALTEYWGVRCQNCGKAGWKDAQDWVYPTGNHCAGGCSDADRDLRMVMNQMLFEALLAIETPLRGQE